MTDITLLTDHRYVNPKHTDWYIGNILEEDRLVRLALEARGLTVNRTNWDNPDYDWAATRFAIFRTTWDYFNRFAEFSAWLRRTQKLTRFINPPELIWWNLDKHYLSDLQQRNIPIPPTLFIEPGEQRTLAEMVRTAGWKECILKPAVSGAARHTYRFVADDAAKLESVFSELIKQEAMLLQEFQQPVLEKGEVAFMLFAGKYSHAVLKRARPGDFRVQDDFGGTVHHYTPTPEEIQFAEKVVSACTPLPVYARVDAIWDNSGKLCVSELELIEPELWFRFHPPAAECFADAVMKFMKNASA